MSLRSLSADRAAASSFVIAYLSAGQAGSLRLASAEHVFTTLQGRPLGITGTCSGWWNRYAAKARIDKDVSPHTLRQSFATDLYQEKSKIRLVQKVLGHFDLSTTMIYMHVFNPEVETVLKSFFS